MIKVTIRLLEEKFMKQDLVMYKRMPIWTVDTMPEAVQRKHNTKVGTWGKITVLTGELKFIEMTEDGEEVTLETLFNKFLIKNVRDGIKVLGNGELNKKLTVKLHKVSKSAQAAIEAKGGTVELVEVKGFERAESNK